MDDEVNHEMIGQVDLLIQIRTRKIDRLNQVYKKSVTEHTQSIEAFETAVSIEKKAEEDGTQRKHEMKTEIMGTTSNIREISSWLKKEAEVDEHIELKKRDSQKAKADTKVKEKECEEKRNEYLSAEKNLEKMKLLKEHLYGR